MWAKLSIVPAPKVKPMNRLKTIRVPTWAARLRLWRSRIGLCSRPATNRQPNRPKIAPEAPTEPISGSPKTKLATDAARSQARYRKMNSFQP